MLTKHCLVTVVQRQIVGASANDGVSKWDSERALKKHRSEKANSEREKKSV